MSLRVTLPILAVLAAGGAGGGAWLGHSAIAEIDPAYFRDGEVSFHADKVPYRSPDWAQVQAHEYADASTIVGLGEGCFDCGAEPIQLLRAPPPTGYEDSWEPEGYAMEAEPAVFVEEERDPELERVALYASYPVTRREAEAIAAAAEAETEDSAELAGSDGADLPGL